MVEMTAIQAWNLHRWLDSVRDDDVIRVATDEAGNLYATGQDTGVLMVAPSGGLPETIDLSCFS